MGDQKKINNKMESAYPLSAMQEGILFHYLMDKTSHNYILQMSVKIQGDFDPEICKKSMELLFHKYECMRTLFLTGTLERPVQVVLKERKCEVRMIDLSNMTDASQADEIAIFKRKDLKRGFDLEKDPLFRTAIFQLSKKCCYMLWTTHHIILDGWCLTFILKDFKDFYAKLDQGGKSSELKKQITAESDKKTKYQDYINFLTKKEQEDSLLYWDNLLKKFDGATEIIPDRKVHLTDQQVERCQIIFDIKTTKQLQKLAISLNITINSVLEASLGILLQKYNMSNDVVFGKVVSGRNAGLRGIDEIVGLCINTIPVRVRCPQDMTVSELLSAMQQQAIESLEHEHCSLAEIQRRNSAESSLIKTVIAFENFYVDSTSTEGFSDLTFDFVDFRSQTNYFMSLNVALDEELLLYMMFSPSHFSKDQIEKVMSRLKKIVEAMLSDPSQKVKDINLLDESEEQFLYPRISTKIKYPQEKTIVELFEDQVARTPDRIALKFENKELSYKDFNERANRLGYKIRALGIKPGDRVAMLMERSIEMIVGILGIVKAGAGYVPIDPAYPEERIEFMLKDSKPNAVLIYKTSIKTNVPIIDLEQAEMGDWDGGNLPKINTPDDLLYIIYTSGTTGRPKGVMISHSNLVRLMIHDHFQFDFKESDVWLMFHSYCFDFSVWEMYGALLYGGKLVLTSKETAQDTYQLVNLMKENKVTILNQVPSVFYNLMKVDEQDSMANIRYLIFGGESLDPKRLKQWHCQYPNAKMINMYGITEGTVHTTYKEISEKQIEEGINNVGKAIPTTAIYVMDGLMRNGVGIPGEICIAGQGVAKGYWNRADLTAERFIINPYDDGRVYRTGDLARWLPNGDLEYLGRMDEQVKIRGFRIELGEIESLIKKYHDIQDCIVITQQGEDTELMLCAYLVTDKEIDIYDLTNEIAKFLPAYMVPAYIMQIKEIPLTENGKINRHALPEITLQSKAEYVGPRTDFERKLCEIFAEILRVERVGIKDNFFELGGESIRAIRALAKIKEAGYKLNVKDIMRGQTVEKVAANMLRQEREKKLPVQKTAESFDTGHHENIIVERVLLEMKDYSVELFRSSKLYGELKKYNQNKDRSGEQNRYFPLKIQKLQVVGNYNDLLPAYISITGYQKQDEILPIIRNLIKSQAVLRTYYNEEQECFIELNPQDWYIPYFDIDMSKELEAQYGGLMQTKELFANQLLAKIIVAKKNEDEHIVYFFVHRSLWDNMSAEILAERLKHHCKHPDFYLEPDLPFRDYVGNKQNNSVPINDDDREEAIFGNLSAYLNTVKLWDLKKYSAYVDKVLNQEEMNVIAVDPVRWVMKLYSDFSGDAQLDVPFGLLYHGRTSDNLETLGSHLNVIPALYSIHEDKIHGGQDIVRRIQAAEDINYKLYSEEPGTELMNLMIVNFSGFLDMNPICQEDQLTLCESDQETLGGIYLVVYRNVLKLIVPIYGNDKSDLELKLKRYLNLK